MRRHVTMADVADIAQVSVSTVSHVVNGTRTVSEDLRAEFWVPSRRAASSPTRRGRARW